MTTFLIVWFGAGVLLAPLTYAMYLAYWQREFPTLAGRDYKGDWGISVLTGFLTILSPLLVVQIFFMTGKAKHGLKWS